MTNKSILSLLPRRPRKQPGLLEQSKNKHGNIQIEPGSDLEKQLKMIHFTEQDLAVIQLLQPLIQKHIDALVQHFYQNLEHSPALITIIKDNSSVDRLQKTLRRHIVEMFAGTIDPAFIEARLKIAYVHVHIGLEQKWYICAYQDILLEMITMIQQEFEAKEDAVLAIQVVTKIINLEQQIVLEAYDKEVDRLRRSEQDLKEEIRGQVGDTSSHLASLSQETSASIEEMTAQTEEITTKSKSGSQMAERAQEQAERGKKQLDLLQEKMTHIQNSTLSMSADIKELEDMAGQIQDIVKIVQGIAEETNLLALNAAIEAARAGEHGRGFAVVADEVRKLSDQTQESVTRVAGLIQQTNSQINTNASSIKQVESLVTEGNSSMEEMERLFQEILDHMTETMHQNVETQQDLESFVSVINEIAESASTIASSSDELMQITEKL